MGIVIGFFLSRLIQFEFFELDPKINLIEVANLCIVIFITIYIPAILADKLSNKRHVKNTLIVKVQRIEERLSKINMIVTDCSQKNHISASNRNQILQEFTMLSNNVNALNKLLVQCNKKNFSNEADKLNKDRRAYKGIVTGADFESKKYTANTKKEEELALIKFQEFLSELIFKINSW